MIVTPSSNRFNINHGVFSIPLARYCPELENVVNYAKQKGYLIPSDYHLRCLNKFINELKEAKIWEKKDLIYNIGYNSVLIGKSRFDVLSTDKVDFESYKFTLLNLKNPSLFEGIRVGSPTNTNEPLIAFNGVGKSISAGTTGYVRTGFVPETNATQWTQNSASFTCYLGSQITGNQELIQINSSANNRCVLRFNATNTAIAFRVNATNVAPGSVVSTEAKGFYCIDRSASNLTTAYRNGVSMGTQAAVSQTLIAGVDMMICGTNNDATYGLGGQGRPISYWSIGSSLGSTLQRTEYDIYSSFRNSIGIN